MYRIFKKLNVSHSLQEEIKKIQLRLGKKKFATKGKEIIKSRIIEVLLFNMKVSLVSSFYEAVLPVFKSFSLCFQSAKPLIQSLLQTDQTFSGVSVLFREAKCPRKMLYGKVVDELAIH